MRLRDLIRRALGVLLAGLVAMPPAGLLPCARQGAARGMLWKTHHPDGTVEESLYDNEGRRGISIKRSGKRTRTVYDDIGRVAATQWLGDGSGAPITLGRTRFDAAGRVWQSEDARGKTTTMIYDAAGRRTATINAKGQRSSFFFDANGNQETFTDALGRVVTHSYDALNGRSRDLPKSGALLRGMRCRAWQCKVRTVFPAAPIDLGNGNVVNTVTETVTAYDELGRRVVEYEQSPQSVPLASRRSKRFVYDDLGRLRGVVDAAGQWTEYRYDELGNQTHQIDALQRTTRYAYDHLGRRLTRTLPLGQVETMTYNRVGHLETRRDFNGKTTTFQYDHRGPRVGPRWTGRPKAERAGSERVNLNRLRFRIPDPSFGAPTIGFTYWPSGQRKTMSDASGVTSYFYDERDRLQQKVTPQGTLNYGWDDQGNLTGISSGTGSVPAGTLGTALEYRCDDLNRLEYVLDVNTGTTSYVYDDVGNLDTVNTPNAVSHAYRYDALNRLGTLTVANLAGAIVQHTYTKAATGHRTAHGEQWSPLSSAGVPSAPNTPAYTRSVSYGYDSLWRLRRETIATTAAPALNVASGQIDYDLDAVGNRRSRTSSVPGIINQSFTYDANDRLQSDTPDNNGNTLSGTVSATGGGAPTKTLNGTFTYDDRLATAQTTVANAPANVSYVYDGDGNKVSQTINSVVTTYLVDTLNPTGYAQVLEERTNGTLTRTYVWGHALIAQVFQGNGGSLVKTFYAYDGHGNVRLLTDESGAVTDRYHYEAFGALIGAEGATSNAHLYCGERFDGAIGQYYLRVRTMNPLTGRFWSMDKFDGDGTQRGPFHRYLYANASPSNYSDPSGYLAGGTTEVSVAQRIGAGIAIALIAAAHAQHDIEQGTSAQLATIGKETGAASDSWSVQRARREVGFDSKTKTKTNDEWEIFFHGTSDAAWPGVSDIDSVQVDPEPSGRNPTGSDFGHGLYTFEGSPIGFVEAAKFAKRVANGKGGSPYVVVFAMEKTVWRMLFKKSFSTVTPSGMDEWQRFVYKYRHGGGAWTPFDVVIGPRAKRGATGIYDTPFPGLDQIKFDRAATLLIPVASIQIP